MSTASNSYTNLGGAHNQQVIEVTNYLQAPVVVRVSKEGSTTTPFVQINPAQTHTFKDRGSYEIVWISPIAIVEGLYPSVNTFLGKSGTRFNLNSLDIDNNVA
jgi:hypothetical protein